MRGVILQWSAGFLLLALVISTQACSDDEDGGSAGSTSSSVSSAAPQVATGVWYVGALRDKSSNKHYPFTVAGTNFSVLTNGVRTTWGVQIVGVSYLAGSLYIGAANNGGIWWKNNAAGTLAFSNNHASGMAVSGNDVIMVGTASSKPALWHNGVRTDLDTSSGLVADIAIDETGKAVTVRNIYSTNYTWLPSLWREGVRTLLPLPAGHSLYEMGGLAFSGAQTLAVGTVATNSGKYACLWDASGAHVLSRPAGHEGYAGGIVVVAGVARVVGWTEASALAEPCVWVNGGRNALPLPAGAESGFSQTISMDGGQELVGGCVKISGTWVPCLWKDRVPSLVSFDTNLYELVEYSRNYAVAVR